MSTQQKENLLSTVIWVLTIFQLSIAGIPIDSPSVTALISAIALFLVNGLTALNQYLNPGVSNKAISASLVLFLLAIVGGLNDLMNVIDFGNTANQWIRFGITFSLAVLNGLSKRFFPNSNTGRVFIWVLLLYSMI